MGIGFNGPRHLYSSIVEVYRLTDMIVDGYSVNSWHRVESVLDPCLGSVGMIQCRLAIGFARPGKDVLVAPVAGRVPDRIGVMFCDLTPDLRAGDRIKAIQGPVAGIFEIRSIPEVILNYDSASHLEVPLWEVSGALTFDCVPEVPDDLTYIPNESKGGPGVYPHAPSEYPHI